MRLFALRREEGWSEAVGGQHRVGSEARISNSKMWEAHSGTSFTDRHPRRHGLGVALFKYICATSFPPGAKRKWVNAIYKKKSRCHLLRKVSAVIRVRMLSVRLAWTRAFGVKKLFSVTHTEASLCLCFNSSALYPCDVVEGSCAFVLKRILTKCLNKYFNRVQPTFKNRSKFWNERLNVSFSSPYVPNSVCGGKRPEGIVVEVDQGWNFDSCCLSLNWETGSVYNFCEKYGFHYCLHFQNKQAERESAFSLTA